MRKFIKNQNTSDSRYINKQVSKDAAVYLKYDKLNELIAEVGVLEEHTDLLLLEKVREVLDYGSIRN